MKPKNRLAFLLVGAALAVGAQAQTVRIGVELTYTGIGAEFTVGRCGK